MTAKPLPSNRSFGSVFVAFFALLGIYSWWRGSGTYPYLFGLSLLVGAATLVKPSILTPFNRAWLMFGELLHRVISPVVLAIMFFGVITPFAIALRVLGRRDAMRRKYEPDAPSYWISRDPPGPDSDSFNNQF